MNQHVQKGSAHFDVVKMKAIHFSFVLQYDMKQHVQKGSAHFGVVELKTIHLKVVLLSMTWEGLCRGVQQNSCYAEMESKLFAEMLLARQDVSMVCAGPPVL